MSAVSLPSRKRADRSLHAPALAGVTAFSSVDWPGQLAAVLFIGGCPWRCHYCHNPHLQARSHAHDWPAVLTWLASRRGLLDGVVFSGGEPLSEVQLPQMIDAVKALGFKAALHSAGIYPQRLAGILDKLDWLGLDIKTDAVGYDALTGRRNSYAPVDASLDLLLAGKRPFECRTTWSPAWQSEASLLALAQRLAERGVQHYAVQNFRAHAAATPGACLSDAAQQQLRGWFTHFEYR